MNSLTQKLQAAIDREPMYDTACDGKTHVVDQESYDRLKSIAEAMLPLVEDLEWYLKNCECCDDTDSPTHLSALELKLKELQE